MLLTLPNEILLDIYLSLDTLCTAVNLSKTNRRLHDLWITKQNLMLKDHIPAYEDALKIAILDICHELLSPDDPRVQLQAHRQRLLQNARMCQRVGALYLEHTNRRSRSSLYDLGLELDRPGMYYDCLMLAHAHDLPVLRRMARRRLKRLSEHERRLYFDFIQYLLETCWEPEVLRWHNFNRPEPDIACTSYYEWHDNPLTDRWNFTLCTLSLYEEMPFDYDYKDIGPNGHWSDYCVNYYRPEWE